MPNDINDQPVNPQVVNFNPVPVSVGSQEAITSNPVAVNSDIEMLNFATQLPVNANTDVFKRSVEAAREEFALKVLRNNVSELLEHKVEC